VPHKPASPVEILERFVDDFYRRHPAQTQAIDAFLLPYKLPDGGLQNDDSIMIGLSDLAKSSRRTKRPESRRGTRR
jgi:hypothetical protein